MTTYLGEKPVGIGTIKATEAVGKVITDKTTILGDGFTDPLKVNTLLFATSESVAGSAEAIRTEFDNKLKVVDSAIQGANDAIAKTRNDYEVADQEIRADMNEKDAELEHMITEHAEELATLRGNQASLGDQVSNIESKIPQSASGTNHLITKQQLLDNEMDIRDDLNETSSELQTQITAQAGEIAKVKQEVAGLGGLSFEVVDELPTVGKEGTIYLVPSGGEAPNLRDEYVWVNGAFEIIGSTQVDLTGYVKDTDFASSSKGGVVKISDAFGIITNEDGALYAARANLDGYNAKSKHYVIGKDTLENIKNDLVKRAVTENNIVLTDEEKTAAQEWLGGLPLSGGTLTGVLTLTAEKVAKYYQYGTALKILSATEDGKYSAETTISVTPYTGSLSLNGVSVHGVVGITPNTGTSNPNLGSSTYKWANVYTKKLNNGADIAIPTTGGTMALESNVVALSESTVELATNTIYNAGEMATLSIAFPTADETYVSQLNFTSGSTATAFTAPDTVKWIGDDVTDGAFIPATNKRYAIMFYYDGIQLRGAIQGA